MKNILGVQLYNQTEVAALLGVTTATVRKYVKEGKINSTLIGGRHYYSEDEIKRFIRVLPPLQQQG
jgi:excisionase family DNA binding protein